MLHKIQTCMAWEGRKLGIYRLKLNQQKKKLNSHLYCFNVIKNRCSSNHNTNNVSARKEPTMLSNLWFRQNKKNKKRGSRAHSPVLYFDQNLCHFQQNQLVIAGHWSHNLEDSVERLELSPHPCIHRTHNLLAYQFLYQ